MEGKEVHAMKISCVNRMENVSQFAKWPDQKETGKAVGHVMRGKFVSVTDLVDFQVHIL